MVTLDCIVNEGSTLKLLFTLASPENVVVTPTSLTWTLVDSRSKVVNGLERVSVSGLGLVTDSFGRASTEITLSGTDLLVLAKEEPRKGLVERNLVVEAKYGEDVPVTEWYRFYICSIPWLSLNA